MTTEPHREKALYLHGGPALSAIPERIALGDEGEIYWWDQPRPDSADAQPYSSLLAAAATELCRMVARVGQPVTLIANSFGAHLALQLSDRLPEKISRIILLAPTFDMRASFANFARRIAASSSEPTELLRLADAAEAKPADREAFWQLVFGLVGTPGFADYYWSPGADERKRWFNTLLADPDVFDFPSFSAILDDFLHTAPFNGRSAFLGPVSIQCGRYDPLNRPEAIAAAWTKFYPQATIETRNAGHLLHLELPIADWFGA